MLALVGAPVVVHPLSAQQKAAAPHDVFESTARDAAKFGPEFKYDVVSIRANKADSPRFQGQFLPDGVTLRGTNFWWVFNLAYGAVPRYQLVGAPDWWLSDKYDVIAKTDAAVAEKLQALTPSEQKRAWAWMLQELLADRFRLKVHWETRQLPVYFLTVAEGRPKFKQVVPGTGRNRPPARSIGYDGPTSVKCRDLSMDRLAARVLGEQLGRPVIDRTGLTGHYDFDLHWTSNNNGAEQTDAPFAAGGAVRAASNDQPAFSAATPTGGTNLPKALEQQLGLKLEPGKGPVEVLVIDHVERPSEN